MRKIWVPDGSVPHHVNFHAHSNHSDGVLTPKEIEDRAKEWRGIIAITDHNTAAAHEHLISPHIIPGIEVKVSDEDEGIDILLYHTREKLLALCEDVIYPTRDPRNKLYAPTRLRLLALLETAHNAGCDIIIPHYAHPEGLSMLPKTIQKNVAKTFPTTIELNGRLGGTANIKAKLFAIRHRRPTVAAADSHLISQYTSTFTTIPLPKGIPPTAHNLFHMLHSHPGLCRKVLEDPSWVDTIATIIQSLRNAGLGIVADYTKRFYRKYIRPINPDDDPDEPLPPEEMQKIVDVDGEADS